MTTRKVNSYLNLLGRTPKYQGLFTKINELNKMQQIFMAVVPPYLAKQCTLGRISNGTLIVYTANGSIATKLKQVSPSLLLKLQKINWQITAIQITVQADYFTKNTANFPSDCTPKKKLLMSQAGIKHLSQLAEKLPNSVLRHAIELLLEKQRKLHDK
ncbi:hypothetical protein SAMN05216419_10074 [Nitrosomonas cryotolerans]|uniref:DUF721 domain-containing protein n=1 Tax=Nitrosomonas cryotolerans ATCC 49181 TaxID=1131553 RepID=A0A1N6GKW8_9PROT|nr:DUF721 domain-containing protein [Nitrosomonas cryotolerans]SFP55822.1 hypothetical protein SAMN05216419_10074 [Nitrosomonas cryotolerans]SIO08174.1 hypothetical protein SAMN02743940_0753 [Nitrosomonas cryotolerans ATCC 49181]SIO45047.1 hypothetical protein SAMN02743940_2708 [Nitrosomonas cryotolerans ATCC 49181]